MSMDALEFLRERKRICDLQKDCNECPFGEAKCSVSNIMPDEDYKRVIATVEQWSKANPRKTRQSVFLEQWPNAKLDEDGNINICPKLLTGVTPSNNGKECVCLCYICRHDFWNQEVE